MKNIVVIVIFSILLSSCTEKVSIIISESVHPAEKVAADELEKGLSQIYPDVKFVICEKENNSEKVIYLGTPASLPDLEEIRDIDLTNTKDGYRIFNNSNMGVIFSNTPHGVINGVYGLLDHLGFGFYMHKDVGNFEPSSVFNFDQWDLKNEPVVEERVILAWHNFLSGCSAWDLSQWNEWVEQSQKGGFNTIMLHGYGNTPFFNHEYNGEKKWLGRIANTLNGREWRIQHCNDIRRAVGGDIFEKPYFGAEITEIEGEEHTKAVQELTNHVFEYARSRDMNSVLAIDVDTESANSQNIIKSLPENSRFKISKHPIEFLNQDKGSFWLANPDTPEGFEFYKTQVESITSTYPTLDNICLWFRIQETPLLGLKKEELPESWRKEYELKVEENPQSANYWRSIGIFALSKVTEAFKKAVQVIDKPDVTISIGTWFKGFLDASDYFLSEDVPFIFLEYPWSEQILVNNDETLLKLKGIASHRKVTPIYWAQEDNFYYYGASMKTIENLGSKHQKANTHGYGIIHWLIKPAELFFANMNNQLWTNTLDQSIEETCREYALKHFGPHNEDRMTKYLTKWMKDGKAVGRETGHRFITDRMGDPDIIRPSVNERMAILESALENVKNQDEKEWISYFLNLERFVLSTYEVEYHFFKSQDFISAEKFDEARKETAFCDVESVIKLFAEFCQLGGITRGEQGLLASMNLRWLPSYVQLRQALRLDDIRYNFSATNHELLVHEPGWQTFFFEENGTLWESFGAKEIGGIDYGSDDYNAKPYKDMPDSHKEIIETCVELSDPTSITIRPITGWNSKYNLPSNFLQAGKYELLLLASSSNNQTCKMDIELYNILMKNNKNAGSKKESIQDQVRAENIIFEIQNNPDVINKELDLSTNPHGEIHRLSIPVELKNSLNSIDIKLDPGKGKIKIYGLLLKPVGFR